MKRAFLSHHLDLFILFCLSEMSSDFEDYDKPPAPPVRLTSTKYVSHLFVSFRVTKKLSLAVTLGTLAERTRQAVKTTSHRDMHP